MTLPILNQVEIANDWNQVGRSFPTIAGEAFLIWVRYRYSVRTCIYWASRKRKAAVEYLLRDECHDDKQARLLAAVDVHDDCERVRIVVSTRFAEGSRERAVSELLMTGIPQHEISRRLGMSRAMVSWYVRSLKRLPEIRKMGEAA